MSDPKLPSRLSTESGPLIAVAVALAMLVAVVVPASAQFFPFGFGERPPSRQHYQQRSPFGDFFAPFQQQQQPRPEQAPAPRVDYSRAPPPKTDKGDVVPERQVLVLGDAMADWLAYGLEDAFAEQPDMGVIRKHRTVSGLIRYQPRGEPSDWATAAKGIIAQEKADVIVVMLGLHDRTTIREVAEKPDPKKDDKKKADSKTGAKQDPASAAKKPDDKPEDAEAPPDEDQADNSDTPSLATPGRTTPSANGLNEFRSERWIELYKKKIDDMIGVLKTKGVPVLWVGLPALRGQRATSDMLFLDQLYRESASKAGITYVDVWDGFVDEAGRFMLHGPDFEGQTRRLRTGDGVFFTRAGARKLAHYVDREIKRLLANRTLPVALPSDPGTPDTNIKPGAPAPRPLAGPIVPLVASSLGTNELLGGAGTRPAAIDALAARALIKGEPLSAPGGRADDSTWPRREIGKIDGKDEAPPTAEAPAVGAAAPTAAAPAEPPKPTKRRPRPAVTNTEQGNWPGYTPRQAAPAQQRPAYRPSAPVGRSAFAPERFGFGGFMR
ncbi:SGNH family hydrolase [Bradyrhizobium sp. LHD-71]|uniref:SGNH/GDSL hydrolase family protein n=1 Tax=Bradyrhizobium sp. LHD-71 TaxID=3072141 RepID=UPI00280D46CA|nr:SGNH family hydrolase [Bradyrhizobium sp. LHD-71]MDQ8726759.1 SGNH family hydrolase [Bradyrhizobium sp. LHD-71]